MAYPTKNAVLVALAALALVALWAMAIRRVQSMRLTPFSVVCAAPIGFAIPVHHEARATMGTDAAVVPGNATMRVR